MKYIAARLGDEPGDPAVYLLPQGQAEGHMPIHGETYDAMAKLIGSTIMDYLGVPNPADYENVVVLAEWRERNNK